MTFLFMTLLGFAWSEEGAAPPGVVTLFVNANPVNGSGVWQVIINP